MIIKKFGEYTFPSEQLGLNETGGFSRRTALEALGGLGGSIDHFGVGPNPLEADRITKSIIIQAATSPALELEFELFVAHLSQSQNDWRQGSRLLIAELESGQQRATFAKCIEARWALEPFMFDNAWIGPVNVTFERAWPIWFSYEDMLYFGDHITFNEAEADGLTFGQSVLTEAITTTTHTFTIYNRGRARVTTGLIELKDIITNPTIKNTANDHQFTWTGELLSGDRFTALLDGVRSAVKKNGALGEYANITTGTAQGQLGLMILEPGANPIEITSTTPAATLNWYFSRAWV